MLKKEPYQEEHPTSHWQCYYVKWDDGATDQLSPWDMESFESDGGMPTHPLTPSSPVSLDIVQHETISDQERDRLLRGLETVMEEMEEADMFVKPVDLEEEHVYCTVVPYPTDLSTIKERLKNGFYRYKLLTCIFINCVGGLGGPWPWCGMWSCWQETLHHTMKRIVS